MSVDQSSGVVGQDVSKHHESMYILQLCKRRTFKLTSTVVVVVAGVAVTAGLVAAAPEDLCRGTIFGLYTRLLVCIFTYK